MKKYRILQIGERLFCIERKSIFGWYHYRYNYPHPTPNFTSIVPAEAKLFDLLAVEEAARFVPRVVGDPAEYELRYLKQRIESLNK